ncbi:unnamed protein product [Moneuplotes crassus]|uniref:C2H2-type domain-containing protein n=1 Tax=Euplotes crassus TaxID=5936 RepID=A0AAD1X797_EUPCR|nr:unnamed protein product [Moneuplotes crassus]
MSLIPGNRNKNVEVIHKTFDLIGDLPSDRWAEAIYNTFNYQKLTEKFKADGKQQKECMTYNYLLDLLDNTLEQKNMYLNKNTVSIQKFKDDTPEENEKVATQKLPLQKEQKVDEEIKVKDSQSSKLESLKSAKPQSTEKVSKQQIIADPESEGHEKSVLEIEDLQTKKATVEQNEKDDNLNLLSSSTKKHPTAALPVCTETLPEILDNELPVEPQAKVESSQSSVKDVLPEELKEESKPNSTLSILNQFKKVKVDNRPSYKSSKYFWECPCCGKQLRSPKSLRLHIRTHWSLNREGRPYKCPIPDCERSQGGFNFRYHFNLHYKTHKKHPLFQREILRQNFDFELYITQISETYLEKVQELKKKKHKRLLPRVDLEFSNIMGMNFQAYAETLHTE